jgi:aromatic-L-amino-acid/L-tryptophan decarboxylase
VEQHRAILDMEPDQFRRMGHELVDRIAEFLGSIRTIKLTAGETPAQVRGLMGHSGLPERGSDPESALREVSRLLLEHSLFNGHPRFMGYISSSAAPIGVLADLLAAAVNPNVGGWELSPVASEIEAESVRWIAELVGYPVSAGGLLVSGGNMANVVCFLAGRRAMLGEQVRAAGLVGAGATRDRV